MLAVLCAAGFLRISGAMCSLTFNFASARIKCFLSFIRKYLPQFRVSILLKKYEGRLSLKTQLKIEFLLPYTGSTKVLENIPESFLHQFLGCLWWKTGFSRQKVK